MEPSFEASAASGLLPGQSTGMNGFAHRDGSGSAAQPEVGVSVDGSENQRSDQIATEHHNTNNLLAQHSQSLDSASGEATSAPADGVATSVHPLSNEPTLSAAADQHAEQQNSSVPKADAAAASIASAGDIIAGGVDFQSLLNHLAQHPTNFPQADDVAPSEAIPNAPSISATLAGNPNLPPRPPPQEKPATHPNYNPSDDIRAYHPHSQQNPAASYRTQNSPHALNTSVPGMSPQPPPFQPTPSSITYPGQSPDTPSSYRQRDAFERRPDGDATDGSSVQWSADVERMYAEFLQDETANVAEGRWDKFPTGSRLFVGKV